ncbi:MAG TPA: DUF2946 family protein [Roseovarius sp.]|nr:DUF2946 family protein [Roseovarius sp.]
MWSRPLMMASLDRLMAFVLSVLLAVQVAVAFLPVSSATAQNDGGFSLILCTGDGTRTITLAADDSGDVPPAAPSNPNGHCPFCILSADIPACDFAPAVVARVTTRLNYRDNATSQTHGRISERPNAIRAPPFTI